MKIGFEMLRKNDLQGLIEAGYPIIINLFIKNDIINIALK